MNVQAQYIEIEAYNYLLPDDKIAKYPLENRDASKLLIYKNKDISEASFTDITLHLPNNSLLIFNNTKVIAARILMNKESGAHIEIFCLEPYFPESYELMFSQQKQCVWKCIVGNSKRWKAEPLTKTIQVGSESVQFTAKRIENNQTVHLVEFTWDSNHSFSEMLDALGQIPIPPYLNRATESIDLERYQTVYSKHKGSVAAPTAGLHFTDSILSKLKEQGIEKGEITLHVGAGTFKPVQSKTIGEHEMHTELFSFNIKLLEQIINANYFIIAVGTTSLRTLESIYWLGCKLIETGEMPNKISQWEVYNHNTIDYKESLNAILTHIKSKNIESFTASTQILIAPGYIFKVVKGLITNFHQPQSTLLVLVSAFIGEEWERIYDYALKNDFRFLSYGDSSLIIPINNEK
ncbi:MAG: S-adenosylmethionine:tRNA ribosyltransferase-isomerase [Bacteroidales bacterium]|nr:S-adenosylmethionine:tRNA ribosyltransferase-isomerase [Bacteroidales bacterium]